LGACATAAIAIPFSAGAVAMQRGQDSDAGSIARPDVGAGAIELRQGKGAIERFQTSTVGTRIRQDDHPTVDPHHPATDPHHSTTDPHHPTTDPHGSTDPHHPTTDPHGTTDPHHTATDPHVVIDPHHTTPG